MVILLRTSASCFGLFLLEMSVVATKNNTCFCRVWKLLVFVNGAAE